MTSIPPDQASATAPLSPADGLGHARRTLALAMVGADQRITHVNAAYLELFPPAAQHPQLIGLPANELLALIAPCFVNATTMEAGTLAAAAAQVEHYGRQLHTTTGRVLERDAVRLPDGAWIVTYQDVTEAVRLQTELQTVARIPEQNPDPVLRLSITGQVLYANRAAQNLRDLLGQQQMDMQRQQLVFLAQAALALNRTQPLEMDMGERLYQVYVVPFPAEQYVNLYLTDITARRIAEAEVERQRAFYETILDNIPVGVAVLDADLRYRYLNPPAMPDADVRRWAIGHTYDDLVQHTHIPLAQATHRRAMFDAVVQTQQRVEWEEEKPLLDGNRGFMRRYIQPMLRPGDQKPHLFIGCSLDITAIREAQEVLQQSEKRYRDLMRYSQALICTHTLDGTVLSVNPAIIELLGVPEAALVGQPLANAMPPDDRAGVSQYLAQFAAAPDATATGIMRLLSAKDGIRFLLYHNVRVDEPDTEPYVIGYAQDITERIKAERAARRAQQDAEATAQARANFLANMSHEIRTPLNGILGLTSLLAKAELGATEQQWVGLIGAAGRTLLHLLNDVLDMSKISSGRMDLLAVPFDLGATIRQLAEPIALRAAEKGVVFKIVDLPLPSVGVIGDPHRLTQILNNLLSNALKFTVQGSITLEKRLVRLSEDAITFTLLVKDTGIGIPAEVQEAVFEEFTQAYSDIASRFGGTGLGLAISAQLVHQMGGHLLLASARGEGATFGFTITLPRTTLPEAFHAESIEAPTLQGRRVLLAEDNEVNRMLARLMLTAQGLEVTEAPDGQVAVELATTAAPFDIVLMDIQMPHLNGLEATAAIRALPDPRRAQVPIVALTANAFRADIARYLAAGMDDCITKPFDEADLVKVLTHRLGVTHSVTAATNPPNVQTPDLAEEESPSIFPATALRLGQGERVFVERLAFAFLQTAPPLLAELADSATAKARVQAIAHQLVPTARLFDAPELTEALHELETLAPEHPAWAELRDYADQLLAELLDTVTAWTQADAATPPPDHP